jgi:transposase
MVDRDWNAAKNIRDEALRLIAASPVVASSGTENNACEPDVRPSMDGSRDEAGTGLWTQSAFAHL